ncbi:MAG: DUF3618 domain-containing protein [Actinomycetota bacterium]
MGKEPDEIRQEIEDTRARMGDTVEAIGYKTDVKSRTKEAITTKKDNIVDSMRNTKDSIVGSIAGTRDSAIDSAGIMRESIPEGTPGPADVRHGAKRAVGVAQENPLGLAVGSVAVGLLAGMMLPSTKVEHERLGPVAEQVRDKAVETGQEAVARGKQVAQETAHAAQEAVRDAAQRTADTARESAQEQGQGLASSAQDKAQEATGS